MATMCGTGGWSGPLPGDPDNNVLLSATPIFGGVVVSWTFPATYPHAVAHVLVYRGTTSNYAASVKIATVKSSQFFDANLGNTEIQYYYWIQLVSINGTTADAIGPATALSRPTIETIIEQLTGRIEDGALSLSLKQEIDKITILRQDLTAEEYARIAANSALGALVTALQTDTEASIETLVQGILDQTNALIQESLDRTTAIADEVVNRNAALAAEISARAAAITTEVNDRNAAILVETNNRIDSVANEAAARVNAITVESRQRGDQMQATAEALLRNVLTTNEARLQGVANIASAKSELTSDMQAGVAAEAALRIALDTKLTTEKGVTLALISDESVARSTADSAEASQRVTLEAKVDTNHTTALAAVVSETSARSTAVASEATSRELLATQFRGSYTGNDLAALTTGLLYQERTIRTTEDLALAQQITLLSAGAGEQFDWQTIWYFDSGVESWTGNGTPTVSGGWLRPADQGSGAYVNSAAGVAADGAKYGQVRLRIRKTGTPTFAGWLYWQGTLDSTWDNARRIALTEPTYDGNGIGLITANPAWGAITVNKVRVDLSSAQTATDCFEIDWVAVGRPSPGASSAQLYTEQVARAAADTAMAADITTLTSQVNNGTNGLAATYAGLLTEQSTRAGADTANATSISTLSAQVNHVSTGLPATLALLATEQTTRAEADAAEAALRVTLAARVTTAEGTITTTASALTTEQTTRATADTTNATSISTLSSQVNDVATGLPQTRADLIATQSTLATATAASAADIRALRVQSEAIDATVLRNVLTGHATRTEFIGTLATATQELHAEMVIGLSAEAAARTALAAVVSTNASTAAASVLDEQTARVTADSAESLARLALTATVVNNAAVAAAAVLDEQTARADADSAEAAARLALTATVTTNASTAAAAVIAEQSARVAADSAEASARTALAATVTTNASIAAAAIVDEQTVRANAISAEAAARAVLASRMTTAEGNIATTASTLSTEQTTRATADSTNAESISVLSSQVNHATTGLPQTRADLVTTQNTLATATEASAADVRSLLVRSHGADEIALRNLFTNVASRKEFVGTLALATQELHAEMVIGLSAEASQRLTLAAVVNDTVAGLTSEQITRASQTEALATNITNLTASVADNSAAISTEQSARVDANAAMVSDIEALAVAVDDNAAAITITNAAWVDANEAVALIVTTLSNTVDANQADLVNLYYTKTDADSAIASAGLSLKTSMEAPEGSIGLLGTDVGEIAADLIANYYTKVTADSAIAQAGTQLRSYADIGVKSFNQATAPTKRGVDTTVVPTVDVALVAGDVWVDTDDNVRHRWDGSAWVVASDTSYTSAQITNLEQTKIGYATKGGVAFDNSGTIVDQAGVATWNAAHPSDLATWHIGLPLATAVKQVSVTDPILGTATVEQAFTAQKDLNDQLKAQYTVKVSVPDANGVRTVGGFGIYGDATGIEAGFDVDTFWVGRSSVDEVSGLVTKVKPFIIDDDEVIMDNAIIRNLSASHINTNGLSIRDGLGNIILNAGSSTFSGNVTGSVNGTAAATLVTTANNALANAATAQDAANDANDALTNLASDGILSPSEKPSVVQNYNVIIDEQAGIDAQATAYGITTTKTAYDSAITTLTSYLGTLTGWNTVPGSDVAINGNTFRVNFASVYTAKQALLNAIAAKAKVLASDAQARADISVKTDASNAPSTILNSNVTYAGLPDSKPPTNADHTASNTAAAITGQGAFATLNQINTGNISTYIAGAAIGTAYIADAAITSAKIVDASITTAKIGDGNITSAKIGDAQITSAKIADLQVSTLKIAADSITLPLSTTVGSCSYGVTQQTSYQYLEAGSKIIIFVTYTVTHGGFHSATMSIGTHGYTNGIVVVGSNGFSFENYGNGVISGSYTAPIADWYSVLALPGGDSGGSCTGLTITAMGARR